MNKLTLKVYNRINEYIGFDVNELFKIADYCTIFGGAVRDSIADREINDVDILTLSKSNHILYNYLKDNGWVNNNKMKNIDCLSLYKDSKWIFEPITMYKIIDNSIRYIQLIRPVYVYNKAINTKSIDHEKVIFKNGIIYEAYNNLLTNVDINICGVAFEKDKGVFETVEGAIIWIKNNSYIVNEKALLFNPVRIHERLHKFDSRKWICLDSEHTLMTKQMYEKKDYIEKLVVRYSKLKNIL